MSVNKIMIYVFFDLRIGSESSKKNMRGTSTGPFLSIQGMTAFRSAI